METFKSNKKFAKFLSDYIDLCYKHKIFKKNELINPLVLISVNAELTQFILYLLEKETEVEGELH